MWALASLHTPTTTIVGKKSWAGKNHDNYRYFPVHLQVGVFHAMSHGHATDRSRHPAQRLVSAHAFAAGRFPRAHIATCTTARFRRRPLSTCPHCDLCQRTQRLVSAHAPHWQHADRLSSFSHLLSSTSSSMSRVTGYSSSIGRTLGIVGAAFLALWRSARVCVDAQVMFQKTTDVMGAASVFQEETGLPTDSFTISYMASQQMRLATYMFMINYDLSILFNEDLLVRVDFDSASHYFDPLGAMGLTPSKLLLDWHM